MGLDMVNRTTDNNATTNQQMEAWRQWQRRSWRWRGGGSSAIITQQPTNKQWHGGGGSSSGSGGIASARGQQQLGGGKAVAAAWRQHTARRWQLSGSSAAAVEVATAQKSNVRGSLAAARRWRQQDSAA